MHRPSMAHRSSVSMIVIDYPWTKTKEDVAAFYNVEETKGLSEERVKRDLERYGPNGKRTECRHDPYTTDCFCRLQNYQPKRANHFGSLS